MTLVEQVTVVALIAGQAVLYYYLYEGVEYEFCKTLAPKLFDRQC